MTGTKHRDGTSEPDFSLSPKERATFGVIVTAINLENEERRSFVRIEMTAINGLRAIVADLDELPGDWRIVTVSNPSTIARDMYANRTRLSGQGSGATQKQNLPEALMLGRIGRAELLYQAPYVTPAFVGPKAWRA